MRRRPEPTDRRALFGVAPRGRPVEPSGDAELDQILSLRRSRTAAHRLRLAALTQATRRGAAPGVLLARTDLSPDLAIFQIAKPEALVFEPGQAIKIGVGGVRRRYTIASSPSDPHVELCVERVPGGELTSKLFALAPGANVEVADAAQGDLVLDSGAQAHLMVATVTGVAPFASMLRYALARGAPGPFLLVHGTRFEHELPYAVEMTELARRHPSFIYWPTVTQPTAAWDGRRGQVTAHLDGALAVLRAPPTVYACGHPDMVRDVAARATALGLDVRTESFWS